MRKPAAENRAGCMLVADEAACEAGSGGCRNGADDAQVLALTTEVLGQRDHERDLSASGQSDEGGSGEKGHVRRPVWCGAMKLISHCGKHSGIPHFSKQACALRIFRS